MGYFAMVFHNHRLCAWVLRTLDVRDIDFRFLARSGIKAVVFDKDNTLTAPYAAAIHPPFQPAVQLCIQTFKREKIAIVSNSVGSSDAFADEVRAHSIR